MSEKDERLLVIKRVNPGAEKGSDADQEGMVFSLTELGDYKENIADAMLASVEGYTLADGRTTVVSARLRNDFIITESSCCVDPDKYDKALAVSICMNKIQNRINDYMAFVRCCGSVSARRLAELDEIANEKVENTLV